LQKRGYEVAVAGNGHEALAAVETESFDLVLTDVQMAEMDGLAATQTIPERGAWSRSSSADCGDDIALHVR
jgi:CheY-like chemotaxis protein